MLDKIPLQAATVTSEDELFKVLSRPSLHEMKKKYNDFLRMRAGVWCNERRRDFFAAHNWTVSEFIEKHRKLGIALPHD